MHEMAITQGIVELCERHASGRSINTVRVEIGQLSGVVPESIEFCFSACSVGTLAEKAELIIESVPGSGRCMECGLKQLMERLYDPCCSCGSCPLEVISGQEMRVREIEVDD